VEFHAGAWARYALIALGALGYLLSVRAVAKPMAGFARPQVRAQRIVLTSWLTAGCLACLTAVFDHHPIAAILHHAAPQSLLLAIGLLFVPARAVQHRSAIEQPRIEFSFSWILAALVVAAVSVAFLGPGFSVRAF
jgi:hypothetical protein